MDRRTNPDLDAPETPVDLTNCDREPIHIPGRIQSFGALIAVSSDWVVSHVSRNIGEFIDAEAGAMVGTPLTDHVDEATVRLMGSRLHLLTGVDAVERLFGVELDGSRRRYDLAVHLSGPSIVMEIERHSAENRADYTSYVRPMMDRIRQAATSQDLCGMAARELRQLIGFDRVMVYEFAPDGSGKVIAESRQDRIDSFAGQHFPAADIPRQARKLYTRNLLRIIADVSDEGVEITPVLNGEGEPLDLSLSSTRAVSPIHLEYLTNMGIQASLSISILRRGELWGLFACHHEQPLTLSYDVRSAAELFGQLFAFVLEQKQTDEAQAELAEAQSLHDQLVSQLAGHASISENFQRIVDTVGRVIPHDGVVGWVDGAFQSIGHTPDPAEFAGLVGFLNEAAASRVFHTSHLASVHPPAEAFADRAAGMLALPVSRAPRDYIVLFRREVVNSVTWAGNPEKSVTLGPNGDRLTPRKSFEAWKQVVRNTSAPWTDTEVRAAESLRLTLLEVILRMSDVAMEERLRAQERQELLIAELNHRVRNILNLIRGLVNQSRGEARSVSEFTDVVGGRIHALARAHDQITDKKWAPSSVRHLIETEAEAYLGQRASRISIEGQDALVAPRAFTTLSLVIHELMTNSAKYGALCDQRGMLRIGLEVQASGDLCIEWREVGGPPITSRPARRGFGSTIIEQSIPYELGGTSAVRYPEAGLEASLTIPAEHVERLSGEQAGAAAPDSRAEPATELTGRALILEDNIIIAMDAELMLKEMGAEDVHLASSVTEALDLIGQTGLAFAILDINLGEETSEPVASRLSELAIPFAFATGYGDAIDIVRKFPDVPVLKKPYGSANLRRALSEAGRPPSPEQG